MQRAATSTAENQAALNVWPEVRGHKLWGVMGSIQREPLKLYRDGWERHGDFFRLRALPGFWFYFLSRPSAIEHVLHGNHKNYRKPNSFNHSVRLLAGDGMLTSEGEAWLRNRRLSQPAFVRASVTKLSTHMVDSIAQFVDEWCAAPDGREVDVLPEMMRLGLRIASTTLFSTDISGDADSIGQAYRIAFEYVSLKMNMQYLVPPWVPTRRNREFRRSKALLDRVVLELIAQRRHQPGQADVLARLLAAQDETTGKGMSDTQLKDEVITLLTAGHETAGAALSWAWYLLGQHPEVQQALAEQAGNHLQGRLPTAEDLPQIPLATAIFEEAMRLYSPAWGMPREAIAPDVIDGYPLPAGATVMLSQFIAHRHPDYWSEPDEFRPERFLPGAANSRPKFAYFPFGGGPRICIGNLFAMIEGPLVLAALATRFQFTLVPGQQIVADPTFTLRPQPGVRMTVRRRA